jgi:hypothetical protein
MRGVSRLGRVVVLLLCVVVVAVLAGVSLTDPFHLRQARYFTAGLIALALVLLTALLANATPRGPLRWVTLVLGVAAVLGWGAFVYGASALAGGGKAVARSSRSRSSIRAWRARPRRRPGSWTPARSRSPSAPAVTGPE